MGTLACIDWYERDGKRVTMTGGRSGIAEALETSPANDQTAKEVIDFRGTIDRLEVGLGDPSDRYNVLRREPLNAELRGAGKGNSQAVLRSLQTGGRYVPGVTREEPAVHYLGFEDLLIDVRGLGTYPIGTGVESRAGRFSFRRALCRSDGLAGKTLTIIRGMACAAYTFADIDAPDGADEYLAYVNRGPGRTSFRRLTGAHFGRGMIQDVLRTTENGFYWPSEGESLEVLDIYASDTGSAGAGVVNVWGGENVRVTNVNCDTVWATFAVAIGFDSKQCDVTGSQGNWTIVGPGKLIGSTPRAMGEVVVDLRGSRIRTGTKQGGQAQQSGRPAVGIDSALKVTLVSDDQTVVQSGGHGLELEWNGAGPIKTNKGVVVGTRSIGTVVTAGDFGGWDSFRRAGGAYHPDEDMSPREVA